jgi:D-aspartate ligase
VAPEAESLLENLTTDFFNATHMEGMCSMEFKKDRNTGRFVMIEPTVGRTDWQEEVASVNGINIPLAAYCYELGFSVPEPKKSRPPVVWIHLPSYLRSVCAHSCLAPRSSPLRVKCPFWSLDDPLPTLFFAFEWLRKFCSPSRWRDFLSERNHRKDAESSAATGDGYSRATG